MTEKSATPRRAIASGPPQNVSTSRGGSHRHFSLVKNLATGAVSPAIGLSSGECRPDYNFWVGSETLTVAHCHIAIDLACSLT